MKRSKKTGPSQNSEEKNSFSQEARGTVCSRPGKHWEVKVKGEPRRAGQPKGLGRRGVK
jgi:hypothetical protein